MSRSKQRFDLVNFINTITPKAVEFHLNCHDPLTGKVRKCSFLGPNTNLPARLENYDQSTGTYSRVITPPVNDLDALAMAHDIAYHSKDLKDRHAADKILMMGARRIAADTSQNEHTRRNARIVAAIMGFKLKLGLGDVLPEDLAYTQMLADRIHARSGKMTGDTSVKYAYKNTPTTTSLPDGRTVSLGTSGQSRPIGTNTALGAVAGLAGLVASIGIPAIIAAIKAGKKKNKK